VLDGMDASPRQRVSGSPVTERICNCLYSGYVESHQLTPEVSK